MQMARDALRTAKAATEYIRDVDYRLRKASQAHAAAMHGKVKDGKLDVGGTEEGVVKDVGEVGIEKGDAKPGKGEGVKKGVEKPTAVPVPA